MPKTNSFVEHLACILTVVLSASPYTSIAADCVTPSGGAVTLRAAPSSTSAARGTLRSGDTLPFVGTMPNWYEAHNANGQSVFASKRSADLVPCLESVTPASSPGGGAFEIHVIDVGTGLAVLVRGPDFVLLYDAGSNDDIARGDNNRAIAYIKTIDPPIEKIDYVILSHPHRDHVELLPDIVTRFNPSAVWNSGAYNDICGYRNFLLAISNDPSIEYHTATFDAGDEQVQMGKKKCYGVDQPRQTVTLKHAARINNESIALGSAASMKILYANGSPRPSFNENSLVVRLNLGSRRVLLMGDSEAGGRKAPATEPAADSIEGKLIACCASELKADLLIVGHHGSRTSSRVRLLNAAGAPVAIVSAGPTKYATVVLPDADIIAELEKRGKVFRTDLEDDACKSSPDKVGRDQDGLPGGCDNVLTTISATGVIETKYRRMGD